MKENLFVSLELEDNTEMCKSKLNPSAGLIQKRYTAVMREARALLQHNVMNEKTIYDDLNCGKLAKLVNFRAKEILERTEQLRADQGNRVSGNCQCCHR